MLRKMNNLKDSNYTLFLTTVYIGFVLSFMLVVFGVSGIIEFKSPENLSTITTLAEGFVYHFEYHILIIAGALCFTYFLWLFSKIHR